MVCLGQLAHGSLKNSHFFPIVPHPGDDTLVSYESHEATSICLSHGNFKWELCILLSAINSVGNQKLYCMGYEDNAALAKRNKKMKKMNVVKQF